LLAGAKAGQLELGRVFAAIFAGSAGPWGKTGIVREIQKDAAPKK
jgi:hypothetical protein